MTGETQYQSALLAALNAPERNTRVWRQNCGRIVVLTGDSKRVINGAPPGAADLSGIVNPEGLRLEVEVKVDAPQTSKQKAWGRFIESFGGIYVLVRYMHGYSFEANVDLGVAMVDIAIFARRKRHS